MIKTPTWDLDLSFTVSTTPQIDVTADARPAAPVTVRVPTGEDATPVTTADASAAPMQRTRTAAPVAGRDEIAALRGAERSSCPARSASSSPGGLRRTPDLEAFRSQRADGSWTTLTWRDTAEAVDEIAAGLISLGLEPQQPVAIASSTRVEWVLADLAVMRAAGATTTVYPSTTPDDVRFILADSGSVIVFAEDAAQLTKVRDHWTALPAAAGRRGAGLGRASARTPRTPATRTC